MLDNFFIMGAIPAQIMRGVYDPAYVFLSYIVAALASYLALALARRLINPKNANIKRLLLWGGALALGAGIWSMHFIGMLAFNMNMPVDYDPWLTIASLFVAIISGYGVLAIVSQPRLRTTQIFIGALLLGIGISAMHYIGMRAMLMDADMLYRPDLFAASVAIAMGASGAALWIASKLAHYHSKYQHYIKICASLVMAAAICGMHYMGMAAAVFIPHKAMNAETTGISLNGIVLGVGLIGIVLCLVLPIAVYQSMHDDESGKAGESASAFPTTLLSLAVLGTFGVLAWASGYSFYSGHKFDALYAAIIGVNEVSASFYHIALITLLFAALLIGTWFFALRSIQIWRQELRSNRTLLRTILDHMPLALFAKDAARDYRWLLLNRKAEEMFGIKHTDVIGRLDGEFFPPEEAAFFRRTDEQVMVEGKLVDIEAEPVTTPKGTFTAHTIKVPIYDADGHPHILLGMTEDVTERARAKEELRLAKNKAEDSDHAKSEFLANMSHELRTPLNSILGTARLLQDSGITSDQRALIETIFTSSTALLEIVNDILDLSKIEADALQLEQIGFDLNYVLDSVIDRIHPLAREKRLELQKAKSQNLPYVLGDPTRLGRILTNLISNAIKYTERGSVRVTATYHIVDSSHILYRCEVADTGIGIPLEKHASIFEKFTQADTSTTRKYGGTGLGLAITKQLVELMGGTIGLESAEGQGTTFWFEIGFTVTDKLHREKGSQLQLKRYSALKPAGAKILVAEDHAMNQLLIRRIMTRFGIAQFNIVSNGIEALSAYKTAEWDLILMDCHMPQMNGYDTSIAIREHEKMTARHTPIIAMTANAMVGDREKCLRCGMDDYISKPLVIEELMRLMAQWIDLPVDEPIEARSSVLSSCIDLTQMRSFTDGDGVVERELIHNFINQSDSNMVLLVANRINGPAPAWVEAAHMLKGGAAGIGAMELSRLCAIAQDMATATAVERSSLLLQIENAYANVKQALQVEGLLD